MHYTVDGGPLWKFCPLGVLCDIHRKEIGATKWEPDEDANEWNDSGDDIKYAYLGETACLPKQVQKWAGLTSHNPNLEYVADMLPISELNDEEELSLKEVAALIEDQL
jgi:hypothetical protein